MGYVLLPKRNISRCNSSINTQCLLSSSHYLAAAFQSTGCSQFYNNLVHLLTYDNNLLHFNKSVAELNKLVNQDMKNLTVWLNANKILNVEKTELVIFKQRKKLGTKIKIKLNRKRLYPSQSVRYLGIKTDQNLNWKDHIKDIVVKLNRANALLFKIRNFVNITILKTIYFSIFDSHINYANLVWAQNSNAMSRILT